MQPLAGIKVLELARVLAGPWAGQLLADLGATVIKVESPNGDDTRQWGPPFVTQQGDQAAAYFHACNRGKYSVTADLTNEDDCRLVQQLAAEADVVIENFKVGGLQKYGLDYATLAAHNPQLVYCSITGFGQTGPYAERPGYDYLIQGMSGLMSVTGEPDGKPQKVGVAIVDVFCGMYAVTSIQAALLARSQTKQGDYIDLSLLDVGTAVLANQSLNYLVSGVSPTRLGNQHPNIVPYQVFTTQDGAIIITAANDRQFKSLCDFLQRPDLHKNPNYATNPNRVTHREALITELSLEIAKLKSKTILEGLEQHQVPAAPINSIAQALQDPQIRAREMQINPGEIPGVRSPINFQHNELALERPSPTLGADNATIKQQGWPI